MTTTLLYGVVGGIVGLLIGLGCAAAGQYIHDALIFVGMVGCGFGTLIGMGLGLAHNLDAVRERIGGEPDPFSSLSKKSLLSQQPDLESFQQHVQRPPNPRENPPDP